MEIGGRTIFGTGSKSYLPRMVEAVSRNLISSKSWEFTAGQRALTFIKKFEQRHSSRNFWWPSTCSRVVKHYCIHHLPFYPISFLTRKNNWNLPWDNDSLSVSIMVYHRGNFISFYNLFFAFRDCRSSVYKHANRRINFYETVIGATSNFA